MKQQTFAALLLTLLPLTTSVETATAHNAPVLDTRARMAARAYRQAHAHANVSSSVYDKPAVPEYPCLRAYDINGNPISTPGAWTDKSGDCPVRLPSRLMTMSPEADGGGEWTIRHMRRVCGHFALPGLEHPNANHTTSPPVQVYGSPPTKNCVCPSATATAADAGKPPPSKGSDNNDDENSTTGAATTKAPPPPNHYGGGDPPPHEDGNVRCRWRFGIETSFAGDPVVECEFIVNGRFKSVQGVRCGNTFVVSTGWSGQFGPDNGFTTLSVVDQRRKLIIWPAYTDEQLRGGRTVEPDQSYNPAHLPGKLWNV